MSNITNATASAGLLSGVAASLPSREVLYLVPAAYLGRNFVRAGYNKVLALVTGNADRNNASRQYWNQAVTDLPRDLIKTAVAATILFGGTKAWDSYTFEEKKPDPEPEPELNPFERYAPQVVQDHYGKIAGGVAGFQVVDTLRAYYQSVAAVMGGVDNKDIIEAAKPSFTLVSHAAGKLWSCAKTIATCGGTCLTGKAKKAT